MSDQTFSQRLGRRARAGAALRLFRAALQRASQDWRGPGLTIQLPGGETLNLGRTAGGEGFLLIRSYAMARRLLTAGDIGFAEGYMAGEWDTPNLPKLLTVLAGNFDGLQRLGVGGRLTRGLNLLRNLAFRNSVQGAKRNIHAHYDLGNAVYAAWLDPGMTYSSALYDAPSQTLETAQRKYAALARAIDLQPGQEVLELGCGWGGFAEYAAQEFGARVTGLTISEAQHAYARQRMQRAGLADRVDIQLTDYREMTGRFDRIVSIEMFEAVGEHYWPTFFDTVREQLEARRPGRAADHHHPRRPVFRLPPTARLHPEVHLPRRHAAQREAPQGRSRASRPGVERAAPLRRRLRPAPCTTGTIVSRRPGLSFDSRASTRCFAGSGVSTWPIARPASPQAAPTWCKWPCVARD